LAVAGDVEKLAAAFLVVREVLALDQSFTVRGGEDFGDFGDFAVEVGGDFVGRTPAGREGVGAFGYGFPTAQR
jgi:hypothetical protein